RNTEDLVDFFKHLYIRDSKVIVVNSFYDDNTDKIFKSIALANNADFLTIPNKGYGYGNNRGIEYALKKYMFEFLIVSNADITIRKFDDSKLKPNCIYAPKVITLKGKNQNPTFPFKVSRLREKLLHYTFKGNHNKLVLALYAYSRLSKIFFYAISDIRKKIYAPHGSFFLMPYEVVKRTHPIYNEEMFLYYEEAHFGKVMESNNIRTEYYPDIIIDHKEDGSTASTNTSEFDYMKNSFEIYYKTWVEKH
ncbi:MAG: hypothetical protein LIO90_09850, partial [Bacteroidales bacterium]|nr:hypothetical protein [Bacteroidales bacterium]